MTINLLIADDQAIVRSGFRTMLDGSADITVVGEAPCGVTAEAAIAIANRGERRGPLPLQGMRRVVTRFVTRRMVRRCNGSTRYGPLACVHR